MSSVPNIEASPVSTLAGYDGLAEHYDRQHNPMLSLERRYIHNLLPVVRGLDVVDLGCGTGRWLQELSKQSPRSLIGIDFSAEMLAVARAKLPSAKLINADARKTPVGHSSVDFVLASFLFGYLKSIPQIALEIRRMLRPGGNVFISDLHPEAVIRLGWKRKFEGAGAQIKFADEVHSLSEIIEGFRQVGMELSCLIEPRFGDPEKAIFEAARKDFEGAAALPAIYIAGFTLVDSNRRASYSLRGARVALGPLESSLSDVIVGDGRIRQITPTERSISECHGIDLSGCLLLPGLINAHDHLEFAIFPQLGRGDYANASEWAKDIHASNTRTIRRHSLVPRDVRLWWGGLRNLLSGVTTVCHHNPYESVFGGSFPVRVVHDYSWAHSFAFDDVAERHNSAQPDVPFVVHLGEGTDAGSFEEFRRFVGEGLLDSRSVLVHAMGLTEEEIALVNESGASVIWCPSSNHFLFGTSIREAALHQIERLAIGTDSSLTAKGDLLDELKDAAQWLTPQQVYSRVTNVPATMLHLKNGEGRNAPGGVADFVVVRDRSLTPCEELIKLSSADIELVVCEGRVLMSSAEMLERILPGQRSGLVPLELGGLLRWVRAPLGRLFGSAAMHLGCGFSLGGKQVRHVTTDWI